MTVLVGFTSGLSILFAQQYGQGKQRDSAKLLGAYSVLLTAVFVLVAALGIAFAEPILQRMDTPKLLFADARDYLKIIFVGGPFLRSITPIPPCCAASATAISQIAMTGYVVLYTVKRHPELRFSPFRLSHYRGAIAIGGKYGTPPAVQSSVSSIGNFFLQKFMNGFGEQTVAAITTAYRVDSVLFLPIVNFSTAISTLVAQETGAGNAEAARKVLKLGTGMMAILSVLLTAVILISGEALLSLFGLTLDSVAIGKSFFNTISVFYIVYGLSMSLKGYLEGRADMVLLITEHAKLSEKIQAIAEQKKDKAERRRRIEIFLYMLGE